MRNKKFNKEIGIMLLTLLLIILVSEVVFAFSVSRPHMEKDSEGNPYILLSPGETTGMTFVLQNGGGATSALTVRADLIEGSEVIEITDSENIYNIPAGERVDVNALISIPENAQIGDSYNIAVGFATLGGGAAGSFTFQSAIQQKFKIIVGEVVEEAPPEVPGEQPGLQPEATTKPNIFWIVIAFVIALVVLVVFFATRKKNKEIAKSAKSTESENFDN